jgi:hypothetical protein
MEPGGSHGLQNRSRPDSVGLGGFDSHALPPLARREWWFDSEAMIALPRFFLIAAAVGAMSLTDSAVARAQRDSVARTAPVTAAVGRAPIAPRRAFFYSFLVPGYSQTVLGRNKAAAAFILVEAISLTMIRESAADVNEARRMTDDSVVVSYVDDTGLPRTTKVGPRFNDSDIRTRRAHIEDWVAFLIANHLFSGADAFVAAHLWDVRQRLGLRVLPGRGNTVVAASLKW